MNIRADEACHRELNHHLADFPKHSNIEHHVTKIKHHGATTEEINLLRKADLDDKLNLDPKHWVKDLKKITKCVNKLKKSNGFLDEFDKGIKYDEKAGLPANKRTDWHFFLRSCEKILPNQGKKETEYRYHIFMLWERITDKEREFFFKLSEIDEIRYETEIEMYNKFMKIDKKEGIDFMKLKKLFD